MNLTTTRRNFLKGCAASAAVASAPGAFAEAVRLRHDPDLTALISDCHINGRPGVFEHYQPEELSKTIAEILRLDPLPARAVFFGDLARAHGCVEDYRLAREVLKPISDAGIKLYLGMGNHDAVKPFLEVFPEYGKLTRIPEEIVFTVDAGAVDFVMLDILAGNNEKDGSCISAAQQDWIAEALPKWTKPVFVCSHYAASAVKVHGKRLHELMLASPMTAGYIHGHDHRWRRDVVWQGWRSPRIIKTLCLPSTGHWGDIGWSLMRTGGGKAKVTLHQRDFWFPIKDSPAPGADHEMWRLNTAENQGATCTFTLMPERKMLIHSHNDYAQKRPFWGAYEAGADSIEADVYLVDGELLVAHMRHELKKENTLRRLYLEPLREVMRRNGGRAYVDGKPLQLLVDLKDGKPALDRLVEMIEKEGYRDCFDSVKNPAAARLTATGDHTKVSDFFAYPDYVFFDVPPTRKLADGQYRRVPLISHYARAYTKWRSGDMPEVDKEKIRVAVREAHAKGAKFRLWGYPDNPEAWRLARELGLDYINTDHPADAADFLRKTE